MVTEKHMLWFLFGLALVGALVGVGVIATADGAWAMVPNASYMPAAQSYNDDHFAEAADVVFTYVTGSVGAVFMILMGIAAIALACCRRWYTSVAALVLAIATYVLRSVVSTWFNNTSGMVMR